MNLIENSWNAEKPLRSQFGFNEIINIPDNIETNIEGYTTAEAISKLQEKMKAYSRYGITLKKFDIEANILDSSLDLIRKKSVAVITYLIYHNIHIIRNDKNDTYVIYHSNENKVVELNLVDFENYLSSFLAHTIKVVESNSLVAFNKNKEELKGGFYVLKSTIAPIVGFVENKECNQAYIYNNKNHSYLKNRFRYGNLMQIRGVDIYTQTLSIHSTAQKILLKNVSKHNDVLMEIFSYLLNTLDSTRSIILVGDSFISKELIFNHILKPIYKEHCLILNEQVLKDLDIETIAHKHFIIYIDFIPSSQELQKKLKKLIFYISTATVDSYGNRLNSQIIFACNEPSQEIDSLLKHYSVFYLNSLEYILEKTGFENEFDLISSINNEQKEFAIELRCHNICDLYIDGLPNDNERFKQEIFGVVDEAIGENIFGVDSVDNFIEPTDRYRHALILGRTGYGKTELLKSIILADIKHKVGAKFILDFHGDYSLELAKLIPSEHLVYIDIELHKTHTPVINPFSIEYQDDKELYEMTKTIISLINDMSEDDKLSGAMKDVAEYTSYVVLENGNSSFVEFYKLLDSKNRNKLKQIGSNSNNPFIADYFSTKFKDVQDATIDGLARRIRPIIFDPVMRNLLDGKSTLDFEGLLNNNKSIIIVRSLKYILQENIKFFARMLLGMIQIVATRRAQLPEQDRPITYLYIDEFQNAISSRTQEMLTESRKYKLYLTLANQTVTQIKNPTMRDIVMSNTNVKIIGNSSRTTLDDLKRSIDDDIANVISLSKGEFIIKSGDAPIVRVFNSKEYLGNKGAMSDAEWQTVLNNQLKKYYMSLKQDAQKLTFKQIRKDLVTDDIKVKLDSFISAIESLDNDYFIQLIGKIPDYEFEEFSQFFNYRETMKQKGEVAEFSGAIIQKKISYYFNVIYDNALEIENKMFIQLLKEFYPFISTQNPSNNRVMGEFVYRIGSQNESELEQSV